MHSEERIIRSVFEDGYSWVEIPDEVWYRATLMTYVNGMDIDYPARTTWRRDETN